LETRKLRLLLIAYLRGHIRPYYDQGLRSMIRESIIVDAIAAEKDVEFAMQRLNVEALFVADIPGRQRLHVLKQLCLRIGQWRDAAELNFTALKMPPVQGSVDALVKLYKALEEAHILKKPK
jgi:hypothetical protein